MLNDQSVADPIQGGAGNSRQEQRIIYWWIYVHIGNSVSPRSVAGAGVIDNEDISFRHSRVMSTSKAARKDSSCYKFLDPIMGAVIAGSDITQTTASV